MRVLIVDDEMPARAKLRRMLGTHADVEIVGEAADGDQAIGLVTRLAPDAVFLDVQMPRSDGFAVAEKLPIPGPRVVFVTAYEHHAVRAFDAEAADYLLKPVSADRLERALLRLRAGSKQSADARGRAAARLLISDNGQTKVLPTRDIEWVESESNYIRIHTSVESFLVRRTLTGLLDDLGSEFVRIHRTAAVSIASVFAVCPRGKGDATVVLHGGTELPCSRQHRAALVERLDA